jgi:death on curing protein
MKEPKWLLEEVIRALHVMLIIEHGGESGVSSVDLLAAALARPKQKFSYDPVSIFDLAAAYSFGIAKNHPFVDGNKRTAFTAGVLFLEINGYVFAAEEGDAAVVFENLAAGRISETELAAWFERNAKRSKKI